MLEDMCSNGGKPEIMKELMVMMNITKDMMKQFILASPEEKEEMIQEFMMTLPDEKKEILQNIIQMIESGNKPMGGVMKPPMGTGGNKPMGGGMKPMGGGMKPMGGGMKPPMGTGGMGMGGGMKPGMGCKPGDSDCQQQLMQMICSGKDEMGGKPGGNASKPIEGMEAMLEDMCSNGGKPEIMKELMVMMNITKDMMKQLMLATPEEKEEMIQEFMMSLPDEKKEMLQNIIQMIESGNKPMGGAMKPPMGTGGMGMGGGMKPGMGGKPGDSDCQQQLMQ